MRVILKALRNENWASEAEKSTESVCFQFHLENHVRFNEPKCYSFHLGFLGKNNAF